MSKHNLYPDCPGFDVTHGKVEPSGKVSVNNAVTVSCVKPKRYFLFGEKVVTCRSDKGWSEKPTCRKCGKVTVSKFLRAAIVNKKKKKIPIELLNGT